MRKYLRILFVVTQIVFASFYFNELIGAVVSTKNSGWLSLVLMLFHMFIASISAYFMLEEQK